ncbi:MAG TPA: class II fructose-bisphosphate aldolase [Feifaniaceae bacterium]|nr:class II fructose-bisphosphate aldolase [Feifaniaceae bacterium]
MSLVKVSEILKMADKAKTSAIAFNCTDYNTVYSAITVAEELKKPVICMLYPEHTQKNNWCSPRSFAETVGAIARNVRVPVGLHLDHCTDPDFILSAVRDGFTSVMYDGSMLPVEENIVNTRAVAEQAHKLGAEVEAELGRVGFASTVTDQSDTDMYTKPEVAAAFCEQSRCDSVAVAIGSAHGFYKETPKLDLLRLQEINAATDVPLVLHGGSGIPDDQLQIAFRQGINKFNVGTEYFWLYSETIRKYYAEPGADFFRLPEAVQAALMGYLRKKMQLCTMTV